ncbi:hypothetical protein [Ammoniphilus sp. YIM 78166]|uniref:hypothetical protein n=1 Tax=Ammoniphilus sp. YIM 78166 TaxID=1644106 RepID=UPI00106F51AE|nr:hypothetical protein [Ammoniphilus sp. YIM 78166]
MSILTEQQVTRIIELMRMDSNNFNQLISMEFRHQLMNDYGLTLKEIEIMEVILSEAYRNIKALLSKR